MPSYKVGDADELGVDSKSITEFIQREWQRPIALSLPWFYDWQFRQSPDNAGTDRCILILDEDDQVFGFMGLNNRRFYLGGRALKGCELTTWMISEQVRGMGYGAAMLNYLKGSYEVLVGMGISDMAIPVYTRLGFRYIRHIPRYVRVFNLKAVKSFSEITPLGHKLIHQYASIPKMSYKSHHIALADAAPLAHSLHRDFHCFSRDAEYLKWRYSGHPVYQYLCFSVEVAEHTAVVILRIEEKEPFKIVHVIDIFGNELAFPGVVHFLEDFCKDINADFSDFFCTSPRVSHVFWFHGWFSVLDDHYIQVPNLFYPIEMRNPPTTSVTFWSKYDMCSLLDQSRLYITKGDCDLDRPTIRYLHEKGHAL